MLSRWAASPSKTFFAGCLSFALGIGAHALDERPWLWAAFWIITALVWSSAVIVVWRRPVVRFVLVTLLFAWCGLARYDTALPDKTDGRSVVWPERPATFTGEVRDEPRESLSQTAYVVDHIRLSDMAVTGAYRPDEAARVLGGPTDRARRGDRVTWRCRPRPPPPAVGVSDLFLRDIVWSCRPVGGIKVLAEDDPPVGGMDRSRLQFVSGLDGVRRHLRAAAGRMLPEPEASFLLGLLIGDRDSLPKDISGDFRAAGVSHILAVSGYNVTRVVDIILIVLAVALVRRRQAAALAAVLVVGFAALAGGGASVVRAALMGCLSLGAILANRRYCGMNALVAAAAAMLAANPLILRHDAGFQLSFAAVWGLHAFGQPFARAVKFLPERFGLRQAGGETIAATLATLPLSLHLFGFLPGFGLLANLLILPLVPWAMAAGATAVALGAAVETVGRLPAAVAFGILRLVEWLAHFFASGAWFGLHLQPGALATAVLYAWIGLLWWALNYAEPIVLWRKRQWRFRPLARGDGTPPAGGSLEFEIENYE